MTLLANLYRHHGWANLTLIDHLATLSKEDRQRKAPGGFGAIDETLVHMVTAEGRFLDVIEGNGNAGAWAPTTVLSLADLRAAADSQPSA